MTADHVPGKEQDPTHASPRGDRPRRAGAGTRDAMRDARNRVIMTLMEDGTPAELIAGILHVSERTVRYVASRLRRREALIRPERDRD